MYNDFTDYFNGQHGTNYTFQDIKKIYSDSCGQTLDLDNLNFTSDDGSLLCGKEPMDIAATLYQPDACSDSTLLIATTATEIYKAYKDSLLGAFNEAYTSKCLNAGAIESFTLNRPVSEYHYTLYYYDQAGNLIKTISPEGVHPNRDDTWLAQIKTKRAAGEVQTPDHTLPVMYRYNSLNQVVTQNSPDGGYSYFFYDRLGRLVVSQNAKQKAADNYSYTRYDYLGRITEVGEKSQSTAMTNSTSRSQSSLQSWLNYTYTLNSQTVLARQVTRTVYDLPAILPLVPGSTASSFRQKSYTMRNRVSNTLLYDVLLPGSPDPVYSDYASGSFYSYDIHGNVDTLLQDYRTGLMTTGNGKNRFKLTAYNYDLISGKVNQVHFQPGEKDQFYHRYEYDAENRLTGVFTTDVKEFVGTGNNEDHEASYEYYKHGPLARTVLGQQQVQGIDYAYTLQGWLKGVNSTSLMPDRDMGGDDGSFIASLGYGAISPSFAIEFDTYQNGAGAGQTPYTGITIGDPANDHLAYHRLGNYTSTGRIGNNIDLGNIEDNNWHDVEIDWNAGTKTLKTFLDGVEKRSEVRDIVRDDLLGNPLVYFGFTASTGGNTNEQAVCVQEITATIPAALTKSVFPTSINDGSVAAFTWSVANSSPGSGQQTGIGFTDALPSGLKVAGTPSVSFSGWMINPSVTAVAGSASVVVSGGSIAAGATATVSVSITNATGQSGSCPNEAFTNGAAKVTGLSNNLNNKIGDGPCLTVNNCAANAGTIIKN